MAGGVPDISFKTQARQESDMSRMIEQQLNDISSVIGNGMGEDYGRRVRRGADALCSAVDATEAVNARLALAGALGVCVSPYVRRGLQVLSAESARLAAAA
jgi:hypothetical protein